MRVLLITATYPPSINGNALSVKNLKDKIQDLGHSVLVLAPDNHKDINEKGVIYYSSIPNPLINDYPIPLSPLTITSFNKIKEFKPDIVHVHHPYHIGFFANIISEKLKIPLVFTYHTNYDFYAKKYFDFLPKDLRNKFLLNSVFEFCKKTDLVIAPSESVNKYIKKNLPYQQVLTLPTIIDDLNHTKTSKGVIKEKMGLPKEKNILLVVSRLSNEKNIHLIIRAMKNLKKKYFLLICGTGMAKNKLKKMTARLKLEKHIRFAGNINRNKLGEYYSVADYLINTSISETQGLNLYEALSFGLPIVSVKSDVSKEWVKKDFGVVVENNVSSLTEGINKIDKMKYVDMSKKALIFSKKTSPNKSVGKLLKVYEKLISGNVVKQKLLETGWQSWSTNGNSKKSIFLERNYNPLDKEFIPEVETVIKLKNPAVGWCSWYAFGRNINENNILSQSKWFKENPKIPVEYILIDEGYCKWGDWLEIDKNKFPNGFDYLFSEIRKNKQRVGLWIAPFLIERNSRLFNKHPDWVTQTNNKPVLGIKASPLDKYVFERYVLDIRKQEVKDYVFETIDKILEDGKVELLKLDFLFCIYFIPKVTHLEAGKFVREMFNHIRIKYPKVYTISCGVPLVPCIGVVDSMRIGPDTISPIVEKIPFLFKLFNKLRIKEVFANIEKRIWTKKYWNLDPDVFVCRDNLGFSNKTITKLGKEIKKCDGNIFLGDDMTKLSLERVEKFIMPLFKNDQKP